MKAKTEEFLYFLLWGAEMLIQPTRGNLEGSFEQWAFRSGIGRRLQMLEREKLIETRAGGGVDKRVIRLTDAGRLAALSGIDPVRAWDRKWDGRWRLVFFDVPENENRRRVQLRRSLKSLKFGYLQNSVWISPDPLDELRQKLKGITANAESLTFFEGRPAGGESDQDMVGGAWDFKKIDRLYTQWGAIANVAPSLKQGAVGELAGLRIWAAREREAWREAVAVDPFLPGALLPAGYSGRNCWAQRMHLLQKLGKRLLPN